MEGGGGMEGGFGQWERGQVPTGMGSTHHFQWQIGKTTNLLSHVVFCLCLRLKGDLAYPYKGPRTKDDIVEFANRVAG